MGQRRLPMPLRKMLIAGLALLLLPLLAGGFFGPHATARAATQEAYIHPATHDASSNTDPSLPPMGLRLRLRADYDISGFPARVQVILRALKKYGMIVADNGSNWFISGAPDPRWNDDELHKLSQVPGSAFEAVYTGPTVGP